MSSVKNRIPSERSFKVGVAPKLIGGTSEEIKEATKIRNQICRELVMYALSKTSDGRPSTLYGIAKQGTDAILRDIKNNPLINGASGKLRQEKLTDAINGYKDLSERIARYNKIVSNTSVSFWIKNRTNQLENLNNKKFKKKIDGK